ncbi:helix-turn-helix domain-containing protein [Streptomyces poonensis]|uniref:AraC family transcriptional regulator n=1 Tax=Streptomyces poonensis TaxID=68255 RepID=A0A918UF66_9ACTN|nr:helix-turn-helix domain-containing protein [Streptomyces poonensis]GGZ03406.1 AraC family transcriptional regulator [Streptomyces poonensis]GLJ92994.1 AraC family transcriptional regulator [Streptomyces poonensis]
MEEHGTAPVAVEERLTAWQDALRSWWVPVRVTVRSTSSFDAGIGAARFGYAVALTATADACRISRLRPPAVPAAHPRVCLALQRAGSGALVQGGRHTALETGDLVLIDPDLPFSLDLRSRFTIQILHLPLRAVGVPRSRLAALTGRTVPMDQGAPALAAAFVDTLATTGDRLPAPAGERLAGVGADLLAALVDELSPPAAPDEPLDGNPLGAAVRGYIEQHLGDPGLTPENIAAAHGVSVRYLHRVFETEQTTLMRYVQRRRVEECARELARRRRAAPTVSAVAHRWGFTNAAHFTRTFKTVYGLTPSEWRAAAARSGGAPADISMPRQR